MSERPLLKGGSKEFTAAGNYVTLLEVKADPETELLIDSIEISVDDTTAHPYVNIRLNGTPYLKDFPILGTQGTPETADHRALKIGFGRAFKVAKGKVPIVVEMKATATPSATGTMRATALVSGIQITRKSLAAALVQGAFDPI